MRAAISLLTRQRLSDAGYAARFLLAMPSLVRRPVTPAEACAAVRRRLGDREAAFLALVRRLIERQPAHPYRQLLAMAGCELGDLARLVEREGLEGALLSLFHRGVYLTAEEFKRHRRIVRGSTTFVTDPDALSNPLVRRHLPGETGGSRGASLQAPIDLRRLRDEAAGRALYLEAFRREHDAYAVWAVPGTLPILQMLEFLAAGARPSRWFSQVAASATGLPGRYFWSSELPRVGGLLAGVPLPRPEPVPLDDCRPILLWLARTLRAGGTPHLHTNASAAVRICETAVREGVDVSGAHFIMGSEPATPARLDAIRRAGARSFPFYGTMDAGVIGQVCAGPEGTAASHLLDDLIGIVQPGSAAAGRPGLTSRTLLCTTLRAHAPFFLLNVSLGDQAEIAPARCGCPLQHAGWGRQLHAIRSHEKLSAGGMTLLDVDVIQVLEAALPARFGGGPLDYQLVESFDGNGEAELRLLVHPRLGELDAITITDAFFAAIGSGGAARVRELQWRQGGMLRIERAPPHLTPAGKVLHLHRDGGAAPG